MNYFIGLCAVLFILAAPIIIIAGFLTSVGIGGPVAVSTATGIVIGGAAVTRRRRP